MLDAIEIALFSTAYFAATVCAWLAPGYVKRRFVARQDALLADVRAHYLTAEQALAAGDEAAARRELAGIERLEQRWARGNSVWSRGLVGVAGLLCGFAVFVVVRGTALAAIAYMDGKSFMALWSNAQTLLLLGVFGAMHGVAGMFTFDDWKNPDEPIWLGDQLRDMLAAGRGVARPKRLRAASTISARTLFGLGDAYTRKALDDARRRLARENHPDLWAQAPEAERRLREAAMKRINAAHEQLLPGATG